VERLEDQYEQEQQKYNGFLQTMKKQPYQNLEDNLIMNRQIANMSNYRLLLKCCVEKYLSLSVELQERNTINERQLEELAMSEARIQSLQNSLILVEDIY